MRTTNQYFPVAIGLTEQWGWQAIYEGFNFRGLTFQKVFWLREPSEELRFQVSICEHPTPLAGGTNILLPSLYRMMSEINVNFDKSKINDA